MVEKQTKKKTKAKTKEKEQVVPPRATEEPVVVQKVDPNVTIPSENPVPPPEEEPVKPLFTDLAELQYAFDYIKYCLDKAGYGMEGVVFHHHDFAHFLKIAFIAIQRSGIANEKHMELETLKRQLTSAVKPHE